MDAEHMSTTYYYYLALIHSWGSPSGAYPFTANFRHHNNQLQSASIREEEAAAIELPAAPHGVS
jgi:hypothetical protein